MYRFLSYKSTFKAKNYRTDTKLDPNQFGHAIYSREVKSNVKTNF